MQLKNGKNASLMDMLGVFTVAFHITKYYRSGSESVWRTQLFTEPSRSETATG